MLDVLARSWARCPLIWLTASPCFFRGEQKGRGTSASGQIKARVPVPELVLLQQLALTMSSTLTCFWYMARLLGRTLA